MDNLGLEQAIISDLMDESIEVTEQAITAVESSTLKTDPVWIKNAYAALIRMAEEREYFRSDDLWTFKHVEKPREPRAMGVVFRKAAKEGIIEATEKFILSYIPKKHRCPTRVWRSLIYDAGRVVQL